eukprot:7749639-Alexandrium_andersonii.AAC.1
MCPHRRAIGPAHEHASEVVQDPALIVSLGKIHPKNEIEVGSCGHVSADSHTASASLAAADFGEVNSGWTAGVHAFKLVQSAEVHCLQVGHVQAAM